MTALYQAVPGGGQEATVGQRDLEPSADDSATSEIALLEVHSSICDHWRDTGRPNHTDAWANQALYELRKWVAMGDLQVLPTPPRLAEAAMTRVEIVTRELGRQLRAWDAAHLTLATGWAISIDSKVTMVTTDPDFYKLLPHLPEFNKYIELLDPSA